MSFFFVASKKLPFVVIMMTPLLIPLVTRDNYLAILEAFADGDTVLKECLEYGQEMPGSLLARQYRIL